MPRRWTSPNMAREDETTGDGRVLAVGSVTWVDPPMPFMWDRDGRGHANAVPIGLIEEIMREGNTILGAGTIDDVGEDGLEAIRLIEAGLVTGLSIDPDDYEVEIIDTTVEEVDDSEAVAAAAGDPDPGPDGGVLLFRDAADAVIERYTRLRIRGVTLVELPAFDSTQIVLESAEGAETEAPEATTTVVPLVAAAARRPPLEWVDNPHLTSLTPQTILADGRIFGHAALWGTCHIGYENSCVTPPRSSTNYAYFRTGETITACADCEEPVPTGVITMATGHADLSLGHRAAAAHYDDTGTVVADVACGEDEFGIWFAGVVRPDVMADPDRLQALRASAISGDWRRIGGSLELVAMLAVNVPGFPVTRGIAASASSEGLHPRFRASRGEQTALVASGIVLPVDPRDRAIADLRTTVAAQGALLASLDVRTQPLIPLAHREALAASGALVTVEAQDPEKVAEVAEEVLHQGLRRMAARAR